MTSPLRTNYADGGATPTTGNVTASDMNAISSAVNTLAPTGMLAPVQVVGSGAETYTITSGSVTSIAGTTINGYTPAIGDRILVMCAPTSTGAGGTDTPSSKPANGVYVVTANTTNLTVTRSADMSGSVIPAGLSVYIENGTWEGGNIWTVITPTGPASWTSYGSGNIKFSGTAGTNPSFTTIYITSNTGTIGMENNSGTTYFGPQTSPGNQTILLPGPTLPTASALAQWDANSNLTANNMVTQATSTAGSSTAIVMTIASDGIQIITTGSAAQTIKLPTTSVPIGYQVTVINASTSTVTVAASNGTVVSGGLTGTLTTLKGAIFTAIQATPTLPAHWCAH